jgi:phospholipase/carboxylesterase
MRVREHLDVGLFELRFCQPHQSLSPWARLSGVNPNPHLSVPAVWRGARPSPNAPLALVISGRGLAVESALEIIDRLALPQLSCAAVSAAGNSWYPGRYVDPLPVNQAALDQALERVEGLVQETGVPRSRIALVGFSQGACVACEYVFRHRGRWGALIGFTGGLLGPDDHQWSSAGPGLDGTPVLLTNSDIDPWMPAARTHQTAQIFRTLGANVTERVFPGRGHEVCDEEIALARELLTQSL